MKNKVKTCLPALAGLAIIACASLSAYATKPTYYAEWILSTGSQGIILPIKGKANLTYEAKVAWYERQNPSGYTVLGCADQSDSSNVISYVPFCFANTRRWCHMYGTSGYVTSCDTEPYTAICNLKMVMKDGEQKFYWNGTAYHSYTQASAGDIDVPLGLFARYCKKSNGTFGFSNGVCAYLYWVKIYDEDDNLIFSGVPCANEAGMAGVYDSVSDDIYYSANGKNFTIGPKYKIGERSLNYVAPTASGTKDGSSWANAMSSVYQAVRGATFNPLGGEIRIKKGIYSLSSSAELGPNVIIRGGYDGLDDDETPTGEAEETVLTKADNTQTWVGDGIDTGVLVVDAERGRLNPPPAEANPTLKAWYPSNVGSAFSFYKSSGSLTNSYVSGLSFALSPGTVFSISTAGADTFIVSNCVFAGCVRSDYSPTCYFANSTVTIANCKFYGNGTAIKLYGTTRNAATTITDCLFKYNHHPNTKDYFLNGSSISTESASANIVRCWFEGNVSTRSGDNGAYSPTIYLGSVWNNHPSRTVNVTDCVMTNNYAANQCYGIMLVDQNVSLNVCVSGCRFTQNVGKPALYVYNPSWVGLRVWDSLFEGNSNSNGSAGAIFHTLHRNTAEFVNCEFRNNYSKGGRTMAMGWTDRPNNLSLIHCLFRDNDVFNSSGARISEIDWTRTAYTGSASAAFVNTIFTNSVAKDYVAVSPHVDEIFANCFLQGTNLTALTWNSGQGWRANDLTGVVGAPGLANDLITTRYGLSFSHLANKSPLRWKARKVYLASNGYCYLYHPNNANNKRWQSLQTDYNTALKYLTSAEGAALGLDPNNKPIQDARRRDRPRKISPGPVDYGVPRTFMTVR